jgi:hypothetical protein
LTRIQTAAAHCEDVIEHATGRSIGRHAGGGFERMGNLHRKLAAIGMRSTQPKYDAFLGFVYDWQTLISDGIALLAGVVVYAQLVVQRKQLAEDRRKQLELSKRRERAARIRIPHVLAELMEFVEDGFYSMGWKYAELHQAPYAACRDVDVGSGDYRR